MRRVHLKGRENILKRLLIHAAGFNLALVMRKTLGVGKPRRLQGLAKGLFALFSKIWRCRRRIVAVLTAMAGRTLRRCSLFGATRLPVRRTVIPAVSWK